MLRCLPLHKPGTQQQPTVYGRPPWATLVCEWEIPPWRNLIRRVRFHKTHDRILELEQTLGYVAGGELIEDGLPDWFREHRGGHYAEMASLLIANVVALVALVAVFGWIYFASHKSKLPVWDGTGKPPACCAGAPKLVPMRKAGVCDKGLTKVKLGTVSYCYALP